MTEAQSYIIDPDGSIKATGDVYLYGKEINDETYAICKSDMMIKGNNPEKGSDAGECRILRLRPATTKNAHETRALCPLGLSQTSVCDAVLKLTRSG